MESAQKGSKFDQKFVQAQAETWKSITSEKDFLGPIKAQNFNHWVLAKDISVEGGRVKLCVYTWGGQYDVKAELTMEAFANCYGGFVAARG